MTVLDTLEALSGWLGRSGHGRAPYARPIGIVSGETARDLIGAGAALPLAGGGAGFLWLDLWDRSSDPPRHAMVAAKLAASSPALAAALARIGKARPALGGLAGDWPVLMGVINVTPDSFSDAGEFAEPGAAVDHGLALLEAGARILDVGGESARPGAPAVPVVEELRRVLPVIAKLAPAAHARGAIVSIDTRNAMTMRQAIAAGAGMINDISALGHDPESMAVARDCMLPIVLMHMQGTPETMQRSPRYEDVVCDIFDWFGERLALCAASGIEPARLIADVGIGFGKTVEHNHRLLGWTSLFHALGVPLAIGVSRKSFIARTWRPVPEKQRLPGSLAAGLEAVRQGAQILRVHDVEETAQAVAVLSAVLRQE